MKRRDWVIGSVITVLMVVLFFFLFATAEHPPEAARDFGTHGAL